MPSATDYDRVRYESRPYPHTHPDHLAAVATLFGRSPTPVDGARVLEIGCSSGGNLLPMAAALPGATFVGIDPAAKHYLMLKSRIHWRAGLRSLAGAVVECAGTGVCTSDYAALPFKHVRRPIFPLDAI